MAQKSGKRKSRRGNEDQVLRLAVAAVVILFFAGAVFVGIKSLNPRPDTEEGVKKLEAMAKVSLGDVESEIAELDKAEAKLLEERSKRSNKEKFKNAAVLGDFIAQGFYEQKILKKAYVYAETQAGVYDMQTTGLSAKVEELVKAAPLTVFLELGVNDAAQEGQSAESFKENYAELLSQIQEKLPNAKIYVCSILPVQEKAVTEAPGLANIAEYNTQLKELCKESKVAFLDSSGLVKEDYYKPDGKHMTKEYYAAWADYLAEAADL